MRPTPVAVVSNDPATVIFPACVGVREREFTPRSSRGGQGLGIGACTCEGENCVRCFLWCTCARDLRTADTRPRSRERIEGGNQGVRYASPDSTLLPSPYLRANGDNGRSRSSIAPQISSGSLFVAASRSGPRRNVRYIDEAPRSCTTRARNKRSRAN